MANETLTEFKTLLTKAEYDRILKTLDKKEGNTQTDYYFDTRRFTLKASDAELRVKEKDHLILRVERKRGFNKIRVEEDITKEQFEEFKQTGVIPSKKVADEIADIVKDQKIVNFMNLSTYRVSFIYNNRGKVSIDKCSYVDTVDYELEYESTSRDMGKSDFIQIIRDYNITYKKSQVKLKRAYEAYRQKTLEQ